MTEFCMGFWGGGAKFIYLLERNGKNSRELSFGKLGLSTMDAQLKR